VARAAQARGTTAEKVEARAPRSGSTTKKPPGRRATALDPTAVWRRMGPAVGAGSMVEGSGNFMPPRPRGASSVSAGPMHSLFTRNMSGAARSYIRAALAMRKRCRKMRRGNRWTWIAAAKVTSSRTDSRAGCRICGCSDRGGKAVRLIDYETDCRCILERNPLRS
jgi:hypothetical protein